jgi:hypothetical protein
MRSVAFTLLAFLILTGLFSFSWVEAEDKATVQDGFTVVVDAKGRAIGTFAYVGRMSLPSSSVLLRVEDSWFLVPFSATGFAATGVNILYSGDKCIGTPYIGVQPNNVAAVLDQAGSAGIANGVLYYARASSEKPSSKLNLKSQMILSPAGKRSPCGRIFYMPPSVGEMATLDLSKLGFVTPFTLSDSKQSLSHGRGSKEK